MSDEDAPSLSQMWSFLVDFKEVVVAGFERVGCELFDLENRLGQRIGKVEERLSRRIARVDHRLSGYQTAVAEKLRDHQAQITGLKGGT